MNISNMPVFKGFVIWSPSRQKFSRGGANYVNWHPKRPKIWNNANGLSNHLAQYITDDYKNRGVYYVRKFMNEDVYAPDDIIVDIVTQQEVETVHNRWKTLIEKRIKNDTKKHAKRLHLRAQNLVKEIQDFSSKG